MLNIELDDVVRQAEQNVLMLKEVVNIVLSCQSTNDATVARINGLARYAAQFMPTQVQEVETEIEPDQQQVDWAAPPPIETPAFQHLKRPGPKPWGEVFADMDKQGVPPIPPNVQRTVAAR